METIFKCTFFTADYHIWIEISLKFVKNVSVANKSALDQLMAWHLTGAKLLPESMLTKVSIYHHKATIIHVLWQSKLYSYGTSDSFIQH